MFSKTKVGCGILAALFGLVGCGILGKKEDLKRIINFSNGTRCLSEFGPKSERYLKGDIGEDEWTETWDCTRKAVDLFEQYVKGSHSKGYTRFDIKSLVTSFLVREKDVTDELIDATFRLKASILGGSIEYFSYAELQKAKELLVATQAETTYLLRYIRSRYQNPSPGTYLELGDAISRFGERMAFELGQGGTEAFKLTTALSLVRELKKVSKLDISNEMVELAFAAKRLAFSGDAENIQGIVWSQMIEVAGTLGGAYVALDAFMDQKDESGLKADDFAFREELAHRARDAFTAALERHSGVIRFDVLDLIIDRIPDSWITVTAVDGNTKLMNRMVLKAALKPLFRKGLAGSSEGITQASIELIHDLYVKWSKGDRFLKKVFEANGFDPEMGEIRDRITTALGTYQRTLPGSDWTIVDRLIGFVKPIRDGGYLSMYRGDSSSIVFDNNPLMPLKGLQRLYLYNLIVKQGLDSYGRPAKTHFEQAHLTELLNDFKYFAQELNVIDIEVKDVDKKRFREADLFMYSSNGNNQLDEKEMTYYLAYLTSIKNLSLEMVDQLKENARTNPNCRKAGSDTLMWPMFKSACFKAVYDSKLDELWRDFPLMSKYFNNLRQGASDADEIIMSSMEKAARCDVKRDWVASFDIQGYAGVLHYVEGMFTRSDIDGNGILDEAETLKAYPIFRKVLQEVKKMSDNQAQAVFAYMLKHGRQPNPKFPQVLDFLAFWKIGKLIGGWKIDAPRLHVYLIIPQVMGGGAAPAGGAGCGGETANLSTSALSSVLGPLLPLMTE